MEFEHRLKQLYPKVDIADLPSKWSSKDKHQHLRLTEGNLKVVYNGQGKSHKDAGSVRSDREIPFQCAIYYFEVTVVKRGRDGYLGVGLSAAGTNLNRLPGWEKQTFGYHGDDGHKFFATGNGKEYGPTYSTDDVIGCCLDLVHNSCFYTKNGMDLGPAFENLPSIPLHPTVGLQTPKEELIVNFGQNEFMFDFKSHLMKCKHDMREKVTDLLFKEEKLNRSICNLIERYLIHQGYVSTYEAFNKSVSGQENNQQLQMIKKRQYIKQLVMEGRIGEAIIHTNLNFPEVLKDDHQLLFTLKVQQFREMVSGTDSEVSKFGKLQNHNFTPRQACSEKSNFSHVENPSEPMNVEETDSENIPSKTDSKNGVEEMDTDSMPSGKHNGVITANGNTKDFDDSTYPKLCKGNPQAVLGMVKFGQGLLSDLNKLTNKSKRIKKMLLDAYSLLAYPDPKTSPMAYQLDVKEREGVFLQLNSAILKQQGLPTPHPIQTVVMQTKLCLDRMLDSNISSAAYFSVSDHLPADD